MSYRSLNIEQNLFDQGYKDNEDYDIVVAANVLHATSNLSHTISQVLQLLKPGGRLLLLEVAPQKETSVELVFGLLPGWWMGK